MTTPTSLRLYLRLRSWDDQQVGSLNPLRGAFILQAIKILLSATFLIGSAAALASQAQTVKRSSTTTCIHEAEVFRCVEYVRNYDGDTITVRLPNIHPLFGKDIAVRVRGIDTPEKTGSRPCEKAQARVAQRLVQNLLKGRRDIELRNLGRDKYFRILAEVWIDGKSIGDLLRKNGLAIDYDGGRKPAGHSWCPP